MQIPEEEYNLLNIGKWANTVDKFDLKGSPWLEKFVKIKPERVNGIRENEDDNEFGADKEDSQQQEPAEFI